MDTQRSGRSADSIISALARRHHGVVYWEQLIAAGLSATQISLRIKDGRLRPLHRGVYLAGAVPPPRAYAQAALFACRPAAHLGHWSAVSLWGLASYPSLAHPWVTVPSHRRLSRPRIVIRRANVPTCDLRSREGMAVACPARAVLDCAAELADPYELEALVAEASFRGLASDDELRDQLARNKGRSGVRLLRSVLDIPGGPMRTRSAGERGLLRLLRESGIEGFETNVRVHGYEVDFLWRSHDFCVELDGWDGHRGRGAFERDRLKWASLQARGTAVMPITGRQVRDDPRGTLGRILDVISRRQRSER